MDEINKKVTAASGQTGTAPKTAANTGSGMIKTGEVQQQTTSGVKTAPRIKDYTIKGAKTVGGYTGKMAVDSVKKTGSLAKTTITAVPGAMAVSGDEAASQVGKVTGIYETAGRAGVKTAKTGVKVIRTGVKGIQTGVQSGAKSGVKYVAKTGVKGIGKSALSGAKSLTNSVPGALASSGDENLAATGQVVGVYEAAGKAGLKVGKTTVKTGAKGAKTAVKGGIKTAKVVKKTVNYARRNGLRKTIRKAAKEAVKAAGRAAVKVAQTTAQVTARVVAALGPYILIPVVIVLILLLFNTVITTIATSFTAIFSGEYIDAETDEVIDVTEYLDSTVPGLTATLKEELLDEMTEDENTHDVVRLYSSSGSTDVLEVSAEGVSMAFDSDSEIIESITPLFNAVILMNYDLSPTETETEELVEYIFDKMYTITTAETVEYCGQDLETGEGDALEAHSCGEIHALEDCPNPVTGYHTSYTCNDCDYYYCPGHLADDGVSYYYCSGCEFACSGYTYCGGHSVISYTVNSDGIYALVAEYFTDPIDELSSTDPRTEEQEQQLQNLQEYYEIFEAMMENSSTSYSSTLALEALNSVNFIASNRTGNQDVVDLALTQVGQTGGYPYWSYYGFTSRVEWCACFVHWCMRNTASATNSYPTTSNNAYCQTLANYFMTAGNWVSGSYTDLAPGDVIFFDWGADGHTDHVGIVIGTDGEKVYTVEGNSGDSVKIKSYNLGSSVIYGYAIIFNY